jgi:hypothetical protein
MECRGESSPAWRGWCANFKPNGKVEPTRTAQIESRQLINHNCLVLVDEDATFQIFVDCALGRGISRPNVDDFEFVSHVLFPPCRQLIVTLNANMMLSQGDIKRYSLCFGTVRQPSFATVFETPSHAL